MRAPCARLYPIVYFRRFPLAKKQKTIEDILNRAEETLYTANLGLELARGKNPKSRMAGIRNVIVFGRAVTNILQNIRSIEPKFDEWYQPNVKEMEEDHLMKFFYKARTEILKEGSVAVTSSMNFTGNPMDIILLFKLPPQAKGFFISDTLGGSGWEVETEEGTTEKYYVEIPDNDTRFQIDISIHLAEAPEQFRQVPAADLCERYLGYLSKLTDAAKTHFRAGK